MYVRTTQVLYLPIRPLTGIDYHSFSRLYSARSDLWRRPSTNEIPLSTSSQGHRAMVRGRRAEAACVRLVFWMPARPIDNGFIATGRPHIWSQTPRMVLMVAMRRTHDFWPLS